MSGYFGTDLQRALQARVVESADWMRSTPGACNTGRAMSTDDVDRLGFDTIDRLLDRDGVFAFRMLPEERVGPLSARLEERGFRLDLWDTFLGDRSTCLAVANRVIEAGLPVGVTAGDFPGEPEGDRMASIQRFLADKGMAPLAGTMLSGRLCPSTGVVLADNGGEIVATAYGYMPHNRFSRYADYAWCGLVAVADQHKGRKLGTYVNALAVVKTLTVVGGSHVYEIVSETNIPSRRMVEACGLMLEPTLKTGVATRADQPRFTR